MRAGSQAVGFAAVVVFVGLFAAGCGGGKPHASVASLGSTTTTGTTPAATSSGGANLRRTGFAGELRRALGRSIRSDGRRRRAVDEVCRLHAEAWRAGLPRSERPGSDRVLLGKRGRPGLGAVPAGAADLPEAAPQRRAAEPCSAGAGARASARLLGLHALARRAGLPRPAVRVRRPGIDQDRRRAQASTRARRSSRPPSRPVRRTSPARRGPGKLESAPRQAPVARAVVSERGRLTRSPRVAKSGSSFFIDLLDGL